VAELSARKHDGRVVLPKDRVWIVSAGASVVAVVLFVVGMYSWRMMVPTPSACPYPGACGTLPPHHLHAFRAELVWMLSAASAFIAAVSVVWPDPFRRLVTTKHGAIEDSYGRNPTRFPTTRHEGKRGRRIFAASAVARRVAFVASSLSCRRQSRAMRVLLRRV
jgi:hypothetical protein